MVTRRKDMAAITLVKKGTTTTLFPRLSIIKRMLGDYLCNFVFILGFPDTLINCILSNYHEKVICRKEIKIKIKFKF